MKMKDRLVPYTSECVVLERVTLEFQALQCPWLICNDLRAQSTRST